MPPHPKPNQTLGPDGRSRSAKAETIINLSFAAAFTSEAAHQVLDYLKSITINSVAGPEISDHALRHLEGQRYIVAMIETRINLGHKENAAHVASQQ